MTIRLFGCAQQVCCGPCPPMQMVYVTTDRSGGCLVPPVSRGEVWSRLPATIPVVVEDPPGTFHVVDSPVTGATVTWKNEDGDAYDFALTLRSGLVIRAPCEPSSDPVWTSGAMDHTGILYDGLEQKAGCRGGKVCLPAPNHIVSMVVHAEDGDRTHVIERDPWTGELANLCEAQGSLRIEPSCTGTCPWCGIYVPGVGVVLLYGLPPESTYPATLASLQGVSQTITEGTAISEKVGIPCGSCKVGFRGYLKDEILTIPAGTYPVFSTFTSEVSGGSLTVEKDEEPAEYTLTAWALRPVTLPPEGTETASSPIDANGNGNSGPYYYGNIWGPEFNLGRVVTYSYLYSLFPDAPMENGWSVDATLNIPLDGDSLGRAISFRLEITPNAEFVCGNPYEGHVTKITLLSANGPRACYYNCPVYWVSEWDDIEVSVFERPFWIRARVLWCGGWILQFGLRA
jgi:hypothetical protein